MSYCKPYGLTLVLVMLAGFAGGMASNLLFQPQTVFDGKKGQTPKVITAQEFRLVNQEGKIRARLRVIPRIGGSSLILMDQKGRQRTEISLNAIGEPRLVFKDQEGGEIAELSYLAGKTNLRLEGKNGTRISVMGGPRPGVVIFNKNSELIWSAP